MKILLTGAGGFVGGHLIELLLAHGHELRSMGYGAPKGLAPEKHRETDILDKPAVKALVAEFKPDALIHLAAISNVPICWQDPGKAISVNVCGMVSVLEAFGSACPGGTFLSIGSSDAYGLAAKVGRPLTEEDVCQPQNPYAISKLCAEQLALQLGKRYGVKVIHTRSFNHFGPGQALGFVVSDFASQVAEIEAGKKAAVLSVGDLSAARDFTYVTDVVAAYAALIEGEAPGGAYNICSGKAVDVQSVLDELLKLSRVQVEVRKDPARLRPSEVPFFVGDNTKLKQAVAWSPQVPFVEGLYKTLEYWRNRN